MHSLARMSEKTDWMFMEILPEMYCWTKKTPINSESYPDLSSALVRYCPTSIRSLMTMLPLEKMISVLFVRSKNESN